MNRTSMFVILATGIAAAGCDRTETEAGAPDITAVPSFPTNGFTFKRREPPAQLIPTESEIDEVQADVRRYFKALYAGDVDTVLTYTLPKLVERMGGLAKAKSSIQKILAQGQSLHMEFESISFPEKPTFLKGDRKRFVVVPNKTITVTNGRREESITYWIGVRNNSSAKWTYIDPGKKSDEQLRIFLPDFPWDYRIPPPSSKKL